MEVRVQEQDTKQAAFKQEYMKILDERDFLD